MAITVAPMDSYGPSPPGGCPTGALPIQKLWRNVPVFHSAFNFHPTDVIRPLATDLTAESSSPHFHIFFPTVLGPVSRKKRQFWKKIMAFL